MNKQKQLSGEVFYRERIALPPGVILKVVLEDVSKADTASAVITSVEQKIDGAPPYNFKVSFDDSKIREKNRYNIRASIHDSDNRLIFTTDKNTDPFKNSQKISLLLKRVESRGNTLESEKQWQLTDFYSAKLSVQEDERRIIFVKFSDKQIAGYSGCNNFTADYKVRGSQIRIGKIASTKMACIKEVINEYEFYKGLEDVVSFEINDGTLNLKNKEGSVVMTFESFKK